MEISDPRAELDRLITDNGDDYAGMSKLVGRNPAYIQQYIKRGTPKRLGEAERATLAQYYGVDQRVLGAPATPTANAGLRMIPKLAVGASAGPGALTDREALAGRIGFEESWLKKLGVDPDKLSLIRVSGDSMAPTLNDGDDIMVDGGAVSGPLRDGIYVIRMDDALMVKRLTRGPAGTVAILSDNAAYPDWHDVAVQNVSIIGRVVWTGRCL